ncbi:hypothetical protein TRSC58_07649 [Trypanosoma rangeli SC58]|uniref:Uncharacterized protein n=1 Tax=Trypanosoma rangeli SC58 TaxID=429131 RepID=A0A061IUS4_TRYRA|nr:hypothetical protein TRSC58_07649 [Trypanosoma rangeli SC58]
MPAVKECVCVCVWMGCAWKGMEGRCAFHTWFSLCVPLSLFLSFSFPLSFSLVSASPFITATATTAHARRRVADWHF